MPGIVVTETELTSLQAAALPFPSRPSLALSRIQSSRLSAETPRYLHHQPPHRPHLHCHQESLTLLYFVSPLPPSLPPSQPDNLSS